MLVKQTIDILKINMFKNLAIDIKQLPQYQNISFIALSDNAPITMAANSVLGFILIYILTTVGYFINLPIILEHTFFVYLLELTIMGFRIIWCFFSHRYKGYALREHDILYKTGILWRKKTILPFNRIQHIETSQSLLQRKFKVATIHLFTTGGLKADLVINGIDSDITNEIKLFLLKKIQIENHHNE